MDVSVYSRSVVSESLLLVEYFLLFFLLSIYQEGQVRARDRERERHVVSKKYIF